MTEKKKVATEQKKEAQETKKDSHEGIAKMIIVSIIVLAIILGVWIYMVYSMANFTYMGVEFNKAREGKIDFYTAKVPALDNAGNVVSYAAVDFRSNPKTLGNIPVIFDNPIGFVKSKKVYVSVPENLSNCNGYSGVALVNFGRFLALFSLDVKGAVDDKSYRNNTQTPYVNCNTHPDNTVILVKEGSETKIEQTANNCYEIIFTDCEALRAVERFELQMMSEYASKIKPI